jgi:hypothetical protein
MNFLKKLFVWAGGESATGYKVTDEIEWPKAPVDKSAEIEAEIKKVQEQIDELNANDKKFEVGDFVRYTKIPNDIIMGVAEYSPYRINFYYNIRIDPSRIAAQYFVDGELKTVVDSPKWFEKVERE